MGRPKNIKLSGCGLVLLPTGRPIDPRKVPQEDPKYAAGECADTHGLMLDRPLKTPPVSSLPPMQRLRRMAGHRRRIQKELAAIRAADRSTLKREAGESAPSRLPKLPGHRAWKSLVTVLCAGCQKRLLGWSEEYIRWQVETDARATASPKPRAAARLLPPPVAARVNDRPYCRTCCPATW